MLQKGIHLDGSRPIYCTKKMGVIWIYSEIHIPLGQQGQCYQEDLDHHVGPIGKDTQSSEKEQWNMFLFAWFKRELYVMCIWATEWESRANDIYKCR